MTQSLSSPIHQRRWHGFTLVELIVAMFITTLILSLLVGITGVSLDGWRASRNKVRTARQAKLALDQMSKDFESMVVRSGNNFEWLYASVDGGVGDGTIPQGDAARLAFFTGATDRYNGQIGVPAVDAGGDVSAVGYRLVYKDPIRNDEGDRSVFALYRVLVDPDEAFEELLGQSELLSGAGVGGPFGEFMERADNISNFVCENIYSLSVGFVVAYPETQGGSVITKHRRLSVIDTSGEAAVDEFRIRGNGIVAQPEPPDAESIAGGSVVNVDISITVVTDSAMATIREGRLQGEQLDEFINKNSYRFAKTVVLPQS